MKKIFALLAAASTLVLTGCGNLNTAASLGDITISQTELQASVDQILLERSKVDSSQMQLQTGADLNQTELRFKIITTIFNEIAKELKISITNAELKAMRDDLISQIGGVDQLATNLVSAQIPSTEFESYIRAVLTSNKLSEALVASGVAEADVDAKLSQLIIAKSKQMKVKVNPRYGIWNSEDTSLTMIDSAGDAIAPAQSANAG